MPTTRQPRPSLNESSPVVRSTTDALPTRHVVELPAPIERSSLTLSVWYTQRAWITTGSLGCCLAAGLLSPPWILENSWAAFHINNIAWTCFAAAICLRMWASAYIGGKKSLSVVCEGPYSICRNPLYWGTFLVLISMALFFKSGMLLVGMILPAILYMRGVVPAEEAVLRERLGYDYLAYCDRVPRWWPRWSSFTTPPALEINVHGLQREVMRILGWAWLPFLALLVCRLRTEAWWPRLFQLP